MGAFWMIPILLSIVGQGFLSSPFREGIEYKYDWKASAKSGSDVGPQIAGLSFKGKVYASRLANAGSNHRVVFKIKDVTTGIYNGEHGTDWPISHIELSDLSSQLEKPIVVTYNSSQVTDIAYDKKEPYWSVNMKKAIISQFQFTLPATVPSAGSQITFSGHENNLFGSCTVLFRLNTSKNKMKLHKNLNMEECISKPYRWRSISNCKACNNPSVPLQTVTRSTYTLSWSKGHPEVSGIATEGNAELIPFGASGASHFHSINQSFQLEKTKRTSSQEPEVAEYERGNLVFSFGRNLSAFEKVDYRVKAQPIFHHHQETRVPQDILRRQAFIELVDISETTESTMDEKLETNSTSGTNTLPPTLASLDYKSLTTLHKELSVASNEQLTTARNLFYDVLAMGGSNPGAFFLIDLIKSEMETSKAARLVSLIPIYLKEPNIAIVNELKDISVRKGDLSNILARTSLLAYGTALHKLFLLNGDSKMRNSAITWLETRFKETNSLEAKITIALTLDNLGCHDSKVLLETLVDPSMPATLRARIISVVAKSTVADNLLLNIATNSEEALEIRLTACASILRHSLHSPTVQQLVAIIQQQPIKQLKSLVRSHLNNIKTSSYYCGNTGRNLANKWLKSRKPEANDYRQSSFYLHEHYSEATNLHTQILATRLITGEDQVPATYELTQKTSAMGYECETFSLSARLSGLSHWLLETFDSTRADAANMNVDKIKDILADLQLRYRHRRPIAIDIDFVLHGYHVFQYHLNDATLERGASMLKDLEFLKESSTNLQRVISTGNGLYTTCDQLGFPISAAFHMPILISNKVTLARPKNVQKVSRSISIRYYQEARTEHTLLFHMIPFDTLQAVTHSRKAFVNVPVRVDFSLDFRKLHMELQYYTSNSSDAIGVFAGGQTVVVTRGTNVKLIQSCPTCPVRQALTSKPLARRPETTILATSKYLGAEVVLQTHNCDFSDYYRRYSSPWKQITQNTMFQNLFKFSAQTQESLLIQPHGTFCQTNIRLKRTSSLPTLEALGRAKIKLSAPDTPSTFTESGKIAFGLELLLKGHLKNQDRRSELEIVYEYEGGGAQANISIRGKIDAIPALNVSSGMLCLKGDIKHPLPPADLIDVSGLTSPSLTVGNIELVAGRSSSASNQCPVNGFRLRGTLRSTNSADELNLYQTSQQWPYGACQAERISTEWAQHVTPQTEACYRTALQLTSLSDYAIDLRVAEVPTVVSDLAKRAKTYLSLTYPTIAEALENATKEESLFTHVTFNLTVKPEDRLQLQVAYSGDTLEPEPVVIPRIFDYLPSSRLSYSIRTDHELDTIPSCLVTSERVRTYDNVTYANTFSPCYTLISADCSDKTRYVVLARQVNSTVKLGLKMHVGPHSIEIIPESTGRVADHSVKADGIEVDVSSAPYTLPEGRDKFFHIRVIKKDKFYTITSSVIGVTVQYSGMHIAVFPDQVYRGIQCGLCGNYDGETAGEWTAPNGCEMDPVHASRAFTVASNCPKAYLETSDICKDDG